MAMRPVYYDDDYNQLHKVNINFQWQRGFSKPAMKQSISNLHHAFANKYGSMPLEISSLSNNPAGNYASAMNLDVITSKGTFKVEQLFQAGKVFKNHGARTKLLNYPPKVCKKMNGKVSHTGDKLTKFQIFGKDFQLQPRSFYYDWIYMHGLMQHPKVMQHVMSHDAFTDIWTKSGHGFNTQAKSCALAKHLITAYGTRGFKKLMKPSNESEFIKDAYGNQIAQQAEKKANHDITHHQFHQQKHGAIQGNLFKQDPTPTKPRHTSFSESKRAFDDAQKKVDQISKVRTKKLLRKLHEQDRNR